MAEAIGIATGILGLAALFNSALQDFALIQVARSLRADYADIVLDLQTSALKLSRWGASIGLDRVDDAHQALAVPYAAAEIPLAIDLLQRLLEHFADAADMSAKAVRRGEPADSMAPVVPEGAAADGIVRLTKRMGEIALGRKAKLPWGKRAKWALWRRGQFLDMLAQIQQKTDALVELFPAAKPESDAARGRDAEALAEVDAQDEDFKVVQLRLAQVDVEMQQALADALLRHRREAAVEVTHVTQIAQDNTGIMVGLNRGIFNYHDRPAR